MFIEYSGGMVATSLLDAIVLSGNTVKARIKHSQEDIVLGTYRSREYALAAKDWLFENYKANSYIFRMPSDLAVSFYLMSNQTLEAFRRG